MSAPPADDYARRLAHEFVMLVGRCNVVPRDGCGACTRWEDNVTALIARVRADALEEAARGVKAAIQRERLGVEQRTEVEATWHAALVRAEQAVDAALRALKENPPAT